MRTIRCLIFLALLLSGTRSAMIQEVRTVRPQEVDEVLNKVIYADSYLMN